MSANIKKILIIGATSGIGEGFAQRLAAQNKSIILAGRRQDRLTSVKSSLSKITKSPIDTLQWDITDLSSIRSTVASVIKAHPDLDTVYLNSGVMRNHNITDHNATTDQDIINEITTNFTAITLLAREFLPHLISVASSGTHAALLATSSGLAFTPAHASPIYCATKAAVHSFMVSTRQSIAIHDDANVQKYLSICEVIPPMVSTEITAGMKNAPRPPMDLGEYLDDTFGKLDKGVEGGKLPWEVATGSADMRAKAWSGAIRPILDQFGLKEV